MIQRASWNRLICAGLVAVSACGGESSTEPAIEGGQPGTGSDQIPPGAPALPVPAAAFADVPATSDTLTVVRPLTGHYRPLLSRAFGDWEVSNCVFGNSCIPLGAWKDVWSDQLPSGLARNPAGRVLLVADGTRIPRPTAQLVGYVGSRPVLRYDFQGEALSADVHLRRDRYWRWVPLSSAVGQFLILTDGTEATLESTFTSGTSRTETEEFGRSLTAEAGLDIGPLKASVSGTLSESYSVSVEVAEESSETFRRTVRGSPGVQTRFMVWILMERYTFTDPDGNALEDPSYGFAPQVLHRSGVATALQATTFPQG